MSGEGTTAPPGPEAPLAWPDALLRELPMGVVRVKQDRIVYANEVLCRMLRVTPEALVGTIAWSALSPSEASRVQKRFQARQRGEGPTAAYELSLRRADGTWAPVEMESRVLGPDEAMLFFRDLSADRREQQLLTALGELTARVQMSGTVEAMLEATVSGLSALGFQVALGLVRDGVCQLEHVRLSPQLAALLGPVLVRPLPLAQLPFAERAFVEGAARYLDDAPSAVREHLGTLGVELSPELLPEVRAAGAEKGALVPIVVRGQPFAVLLAAADGFSAQGAAALSLFAAQLSSAVELVQTIDELTKQNRRLAAINSLALAATEAEPDELVERILPVITNATDSDGASVYRTVPEENALVLDAALGAPAWFQEQYRRLPLSGSFTGSAASSGRPRALRFQDWPPQHHDALRRAGLICTAVFPLMVKGKLSGALNLKRNRDEPYSQEELSNAETLVHQLAVQLERARLLGELRRSYDALAAAQKELVKRERLAALGELAAVIAHEVRNPLGVVFNSLASLRRMELPADARLVLGILGEESERLDRLVRDLLDFARPYEASLRPESLAQVVAGAAESAVRGTSLPGVRLTLELPPKLPLVMVDAQLCRQAILNLMLNGAQASPRGGEVVVRAEAEPARGAVRLDVCDRGPGIPPELADSIFQPFFTTRASGTGLGLAVVKRIVDAHHAEIAFRSKPGEGTTFSLWLPMAAP